MTEPQTRLQMEAVLNGAGISKAAVSSATRLDAVVQNWRRRANRRELGHQALSDLTIPIDLAQLDVLAAISANWDEFASSPRTETMVATVAERLGIDPSRASRLVSEMVDEGYAVRAVSQADARRTVIELTRAGQAVVDAVQIYKFLLLGDFLQGWDERELEAFIPLLQRFSAWSDNPARRTGKFGDELAALVRSVQQAKPAKRGQGNGS